MAERADELDPAFQDRWCIHWVKGVLPVPVLVRNPDRAASLWRYRRCLQFTEGRVTLDVPCGTGWGTSMLRSAKARIGVDILPDAVQLARARYGDGILFLVGDMRCLPVRTASVDAVVCLEGIEHVDVLAGKEALREFGRVLRPDGVLVLTSPVADGSPVRNPYHIHEYSCEEIDGALLQAGFVVIHWETRPWPGKGVFFLVGTHRR